METKEFYRIKYQANLNYANENFNTLEEALERCNYRASDNGMIFKVTEILEPVNH